MIRQILILISFLFPISMFAESDFQCCFSFHSIKLADKQSFSPVFLFGFIYFAYLCLDITSIIIYPIITNKL